MTTTEKTVQVSTYLPEPIFDRIRSLAQAEHRTISNMILIAVTEAIQRREGKRND